MQENVSIKLRMQRAHRRVGNFINVIFKDCSDNLKSYSGAQAGYSTVTIDLLLTEIP